jgi:hypothetical protein
MLGLKKDGEANLGGPWVDETSADRWKTGMFNHSVAAKVLV